MLPSAFIVLRHQPMEYTKNPDPGAVDAIEINYT
jgi:hypothetical protein